MEPRKDPNDEIDRILADFQQSRARQQQAPTPVEPPSPGHTDSAKKTAKEKKPAKQKRQPRPEKAPRRPLTKKQKRGLGIALACLVVAVALAFAIPAIQSSRQNAYLKPYEAKYGMHYPAGMLEQYCDAYGKDRELAGFLTYGKSGEVAVSKTKNESQPYLDSGSDFLHFGFNTVIYGTESQLPDLETAYGSAAACNASGTTLAYNSLFETGQWQVVGALYVNTKAKDDKGYCFPYNVTGRMTPDSYKQFYARLTNRMIYTSGRTLTRSDQLLTLSTDSGLYPGWKFVLVAAKDGEARDVRDVQTPQYPQKYFDDQGKKNPYAPFNKWYPEVYVGDGEQTSRQNKKDYQTK